MPLKGNLFDNPPLKSEEKSKQSTALSVILVLCLASSEMQRCFVTGFITWWRTSQHKSLHNTPFQPVCQIHSEMSATVVEADSRSTTSTITYTITSNKHEYASKHKEMKWFKYL